MFELQIIILLSILLPATVFDIKYRKIPNFISMSGWIIGPLLFALSDSLPGILSSVYGFLTIFGITIPFYMIRMMGAGDIKLMASIGAIVGIEYALPVLTGIVLSGGVMGLIVMVYQRVLVDAFRRYGGMVGISMTMKKPVYLEPNEKEKNLVMPYALPITIGTFLSLIMT